MERLERHIQSVFFRLATRFALGAATSTGAGWLSSLIVRRVNEAGRATPNNAAATTQNVGTSARPKRGISTSVHMICPFVPAELMKLSTLYQLIMISFCTHL